jgi:parvulin-like peptidyl-prolyl isomerase
MKFFSLLVFACIAAWAQTAAAPAPPATLPDLPDDSVVAVFDDGTKVTMGEFRNIANVMPPENQQLILRNREQFLHQYAVMRKLAKMAESEKLDQQSPAREALEYNRMMILTQTKMTTALNTMTVAPDEVVKFYDGNKEKYKQVKVKAIYIPFSGDADAKDKKELTEEQAKAKAARLLAEIRKGADFVKLVKENSADETSRAKDGDFATVHTGDNIPDAMRAAVFALKSGEVSEPVRQPNGFYLFRAEEIGYRPLSEVRDEIFMQLKQQHYGNWMRQIDSGTKVDFPNPAFLGKKAPAPAEK